MYSSSKGVIETPTVPIHSVPFCQNVRDNDCNKEEQRQKQRGAPISGLCGEQMSKIIDAVAENWGVNT